MLQAGGGARGREGEREEGTRGVLETTAAATTVEEEYDQDLEDDDDLDDEAKQKAQLAKKALEEKQKFGEELARATGKVKVPLEGIDEGVIGHEWVEKSLAKVGAWPPEDLRFLKDMTFEYEGKQVSALDHPGLRRNLRFVAGRLNSLALNSHPELRTCILQNV